MRGSILVVAAGTVCFLSSTVFAKDHFAGTWKARNGPAIVKVEAVDSGLKCTCSGTGNQDRWTAMFDGKEYPMGSGRLVTLKKIDDYTYEFAVGAKDHKLTVTNRVVHSKDGKTRTTTRTFSDGRQSMTSVLDRQ